MGAFDSLTASISGMQAQAFALQNISGNIANSQTTAFKGTDTNFRDMLNSQMLGASDGVMSASAETNTKQGTIAQSQIGSFMAINGDGYFAVEQPVSKDTSGVPSFSGATPAYTRRGDFQLDANGYLVNGAGNYLMGNTVDPATGTASTGAPQLLRFNAASLPTDQGTLTDISIGQNGAVQGVFSGGQTLTLANVPLSSFRGDEFLQQSDGNTLTATVQSGAAISGAPGTIVGSALESSNVDITEQFTAMIQTQQAYGANTKVMGATNEMLQTATNMAV
ncbi:MAG: flagellar hook basal-body protein [Alphaproteobacteria bacterium]|nr:flagellar hook basal-body protein [Alphaproteobacteria bacterium]